MEPGNIGKKNSSARPIMYSYSEPEVTPQSDRVIGSSVTRSRLPVVASSALTCMFVVRLLYVTICCVSPLECLLMIAVLLLSNLLHHKGLNPGPENHAGVFSTFGSNYKPNIPVN